MNFVASDEQRRDGLAKERPKVKVAGADSCYLLHPHRRLYCEKAEAGHGRCMFHVLGVQNCLAKHLHAATDANN